MKKRFLLVLMIMALVASAFPAHGIIVDDGTQCSDGGWHDWNWVSNQEATCQHGIIETYQCGKCGKTYSQEYGSPINHNWVEDGKFPTCTEGGYAFIKCTMCGITDRYTEYGPLGHDPQYQPGKAATCTESGLTEGSVCARCGAVLSGQQVIPAMGHLFENDWYTWTLPTCDKPGVEGRNCHRCQMLETRETPALGHNWVLGAVIKEPTCSQEGLRAVNCSRCGARDTQSIPTTGHKFNEWSIEIPGTCVQKEKWFHECSVCGYHEVKYTSYGDHEWGPWQIVKEPTAGEDGLKERVCDLDPSHKEQETIPAGSKTIHPAISAYAAWEDDAGKGKRYEGALVHYTVFISNTGDIPLDVFTGLSDILYVNGPSGIASPGETVTLLPGESMSWAIEAMVNEAHVNNGALYNGRTIVGSYEDETSEMDEPRVSEYVEISIPLTEPDGTDHSAEALTVIKVWDDEDDADGLRPDHISVALTRDGVAIDKAILSAENGWEYSTEKKYDRRDETGREIEYVWMELDEVEGYEASSAGTGNVTVITNTHAPQKQQGKAELSIYLEVRDGDTNGPKSEFKDGEEYFIYGSVTNTGEVDVELYDFDQSMTDGWTHQGSHSGSRYLLKPGETVDSWDGYRFIGRVVFAHIDDVTPGTETETLAGTIGYSVTVPGYKPGTDEVICSASASTSLGVLKQEDEGPHPDMTLEKTWDENAGVGKRYTGALIRLYTKATNTGDCPIYIPGLKSYFFNIASPHGYGENGYLLEPGESMTYEMDYKVTAYDVETGFATYGGGCTGNCSYVYQNAKGDWNDKTAYSNEITIPLTYPDGETPEEKKPQLTLTFLYDDPAKDVYDPEDSVWARFSLVNTGNVPLDVMAHFTSDGVEDYDSSYKALYNPGESIESVWGWLPIKNGVTPGTETEDLLGTVTIHFYYIGFDPDTGEELCRTETISRTWKVAKPGPKPWPIPEESDITVTVQVSLGYESSDPAGYQLGEWYVTDITTTNTGKVAIPAHGITRYDPYDGYTDTKYPTDFMPGETVECYPGGWNIGTITEEDVARGYIYFPPVQYTWTDPDSGNEKTAYSNDLTLKVISKTGLVLEKQLRTAPGPLGYFQAGDKLEWQLIIKNNSNEPMRNVVVTDQGETVGTFAEIAPGDVYTIDLPPYTVTEYDAGVGSVTNYFTVTGTDLKGVEHTWTSAPVTAPCNQFGPVPPIPPTTPEKGDTGDPEKDPGDPKGPVYGMNVGAKVTKEEYHSPLNGSYYELNEPIDFVIYVKNTGEVPLENVKVVDSLGGFDPIAVQPAIAPNETVPFYFTHYVNQNDVDTGYVLNSATVSYTFGGGIPGSPVNSDEVKVYTSEKNHHDGGGGITPPPGSGTDHCELRLDSLGDQEANYTLHACADHAFAAESAEIAALNGDWAGAAATWREETGRMYDALYAAANADAKAALVQERAAFDAYADAAQALLGDECLTNLLRLKCAGMCCVLHGQNKELPDSLAGSHSQIASAASCEASSREFGPLSGADCAVTERYARYEARALNDVLNMLAEAKSYTYGQVFERGQKAWQVALDNAVNDAYRSAGPDVRKRIIAWRLALDALCEAEKPLVEMLYPDSSAAAQETLMNLYKNAAFDSYGIK